MLVNLLLKTDKIGESLSTIRGSLANILSLRVGNFFFPGMLRNYSQRALYMTNANKAVYGTVIFSVLVF